MSNYVGYTKDFVNPGIFLLEHNLMPTEVVISYSSYYTLHYGSTNTLGNYSGITPLSFLVDCVYRGFIFLFFQSCEYVQALFTITDSVYGGIFYSLTGLHGFHVLVGAMALFFTISC